MSERRSYPLVIKINGRQIEEVVIDPHYEEKHPDINDSLILDLVGKLNGLEFQPEERDGDWEFFMLDRLEHEGRAYRLVWCLRDHHLFVGIINCFRR
jgi:hypothetical protein